ncbi:MAG: amidohydrolase family protein [Anaerolineales bacterium]
MKTITLEEHFVSPSFLEGPGKGLTEQAKNPQSYIGKIFEQLRDLGDKRIAEMDAAGIDVQVLSLNSPGMEQLDPEAAKKIAKETNDFLASAIKDHPQRFAGFAALPTADPKAAAIELERTVRDHDFKGAIINGHVKGRYLDNKMFWPIFERAEALSVPIYLHPTQPPQSVIDASYSGFDPMVTNMLIGAGWGWHIETAIHVIRLILGGVFDQYPKLQIIIGHMGETLPFMLQRLDRIMSPEITKLKHPIGAYLRENIFYTFSGFNYTSTFLDLLLEVGVDRIMFSVDYPYASMAQGRDFLNKLPVSAADKERIAHGNAEMLLKI